MIKTNELKRVKKLMDVCKKFLIKIYHISNNSYCMLLFRSDVLLYNFGNFEKFICIVLRIDDKLVCDKSLYRLLLSLLSQRIKFARVCLSSLREAQIVRSLNVAVRNSATEGCRG